MALDCLISSHMFKTQAEIAPLKHEPLFHQILKNARDHNRTERPWLIAVSGGLDSIVLLHVIAQVVHALNHPAAVGFVHHGPSEDRNLMAFRDSCKKFVEDHAHRLGLPFFVKRSDQALKSEGELRDFRRGSLDQIEHLWGVGQTFWVYGHHANDLLETRLLQLIRGGGSQALLTQSEFGAKIWRPLSRYTRQEIKELAGRMQWSWMEDPSNQQCEPLRNWIRKTWLPALDEKRSGSLRTLAHSFDRIAEELTQSRYEFVSPQETHPSGENCLTLEGWKELSYREKCQKVWVFLRQNGIFSYTEQHIQEVVKRCDGDRRRSFVLLDRIWSWEPCFLRVELPSQSDNPQ